MHSERVCAHDAAQDLSSTLEEASEDGVIAQYRMGSAALKEAIDMGE